MNTVVVKEELAWSVVHNFGNFENVNAQFWNFLINLASQQIYYLNLVSQQIWLAYFLTFLRTVETPSCYYCNYYSEIFGELLQVSKTLSYTVSSFKDICGFWKVYKLTLICQD